MDVSGSMNANDMTPSRLEASKAAARAFVLKQPEGVRIGVVSFSDNASIVQSPTDNRDDVIAAINRLRPQRSTGIGRGLLTSLDAIFAGDNTEAAFAQPYQQYPGQRGRDPYQSGNPYAGRATPVPSPTPNWTPVPKGTYSPAVVVLLSDGQNNQYPPPLDIIDQVVNRGVRVFTVGLGTAEGIVVSNQGRSMRTQLDEATLKKIAQDTDGLYFNASSEQDLRSIYENLSLQLVMRAEKQEITWELAAVAIILLILAGTISLLWFNRVL
jgi:Ca-activated chloride channel family protein